MKTYAVTFSLLLIAAIFYLMFSIAHLSFDLHLWPHSARYGFAVLESLTLSAAVGATFAPWRDD